MGVGNAGEVGDSSGKKTGVKKRRRRRRRTDRERGGACSVGVVWCL